MDAKERRNIILDCIKNSDIAISATTLAKKVAVSRQIIVGDVAILRAQGYKIIATPRGYIYKKENKDEIIRTIATQHTKEEMKEEIYTIVDLGATLLNVIVEHPVYGQQEAVLQISSRYEADLFYEKFCEFNAKLLSDLTDGIHLHTIQCPNEKIYHMVIEKLGEKGFLYKE